jgi:hypothetical protein
MHLDQGKIRAYVDQELEPSEQTEIGRHLSNCPACSARFEQVKHELTFTETRLAVLTPGPNQRLDLGTARRHFQTFQARKKENISMWDKLFTRRLRPVWGVALLALIVVLAAAFPSVRAAANTFLGLFRVEQIAVVEINPANLPDQLGSSVTFEEMLSQNITFEQFGETSQVSSVEAARKEAGMDVRLPTQGAGEPELWVHPGSQVSFEVDLARLRLLLNEIGRTDVELSDEIDGTTATLYVRPSVVAGYGTCDYLSEPDELGEVRGPTPRDCTLFVQIPSPEVTTPEGLNLPEIGRAFLQVMGMSEAEAARFSDTIDWTTTLIVPIPQYSVDYIDVKVDGVDGVLFQQDLDRYQPNYMLLWVKDGVVYSLNGVGDGLQGLALANSLR